MSFFLASNFSRVPPRPAHAQIPGPSNPMFQSSTSAHLNLDHVPLRSLIFSILVGWESRRFAVLATSHFPVKQMRAGHQIRLTAWIGLVPVGRSPFYLDSLPRDNQPRLATMRTDQGQRLAWVDGRKVRYPAQGWCTNWRGRDSSFARLCPFQPCRSVE